jgi:DedD protein
MADSEDQISLKKRARRRLVGAIALVTFVVIALPMVFDKESKPLSQDISVQIPGPDSSAFQHKVVPVPPSTAPATLIPDAPATSPAAILPTTAAPPPSLPPVTAPAPASAAPVKPAPVKPVVPVEKKAEAKVAADLNAASTRSQPRPAPAKPAAVAAADKEPAKPASAQAPAAAPANGSETGAWVVKLGAFADAENVKRLQAKLSAAGFKSYTEAFDSEQGVRTRVRAGPFASRAAAEHAKGKLKKLGLDGLVGEK